jgi:hypothetical protein
MEHEGPSQGPEAETRCKITGFEPVDKNRPAFTNNRKVGNPELG